MKEQLELLWQLQELKKDKSLLTAKQEHVQTGDLRSLWQQINGLTQQIADEQQAMKAYERECKAYERKLNGIAEQVKDRELQLYGGKVTNLKELEQIKLRYDDDRKELADYEEIILEKMGRCEELAQSITEHENRLAALKKDHKQKQLTTVQTIQEISRAVAELDRRLEDLAGAIRPEILSRYNELARRMDSPVAKVSQGICSGCHRSLPTARLKANREQLLYCDNCGRILIG